MFLEKEIAEQPEVLTRLVHEQNENARTIAAAIRDFDPVFIHIAARGTSDNAARYAQYLIGSHFGKVVSLATPSLHTIYHCQPDLSRALVIGVSQSGQAEDVRQVLEDAQSQGALTLAITNYPDSPMAQTASHHLALMAGEEVSIAATKTYTSQLASFALLTAHLADKPEMLAQLHKIAVYAQETLDLSRQILNWAERYRYMEQFVTIGRGLNYCTAFEISLKVKELCYINGDGYSEADFRHGPIALIQRGFPVIVVAPQDQPFNYMLDLIDKLAEKEAEVLVISNREEAFARATKSMPIADVPPWLSPIISIIPGQIFAMQQALVRNYAIDKPRGLNKVTVTQ